MQCFDRDEYQTIILLSVYYSKLYDWRLETLGELRALHGTVASRDYTIRWQDRLIKELKNDRKWLSLRLNQTKENNRKTSASGRYERYALWVVILIETGYILIQGIRQ